MIKKHFKAYGQVMGWMCSIVFTVLWWGLLFLSLKVDIKTPEDYIIMNWILMSLFGVMVSTIYLFKKIEDIK